MSSPLTVFFSSTEMVCGSISLPALAYRYALYFLVRSVVPCLPRFKTEGSDALRLVVAASVSGNKNQFFDNANKVLCERNRMMEI